MKKIIAAIFIIGLICFTSSQAISKDWYKGYFHIDYSRDYKQPRISYVEVYNPLGLRIVHRIQESYGGIDKDSRYYQYTRILFKNRLSACENLDALREAFEKLRDKTIFVNVRTYIPKFGLIRCDDYGMKRLDCISDHYIKHEYIINPKWDISKSGIHTIRNMEKIKAMRNHSISTRAKIYLTIRTND